MQIWWLLVLASYLLAPLQIPAVAQTDAISNKIYLPVIPSGVLPTHDRFGMVIAATPMQSLAPYLIDMAPRWVRVGDILWSDVEPERGIYRWEVLATIEERIQQAHRMGLEPMVIIQRTPTWAQQIPGRFCSPPRPEYLDDFANFVEAVARRYSEGKLAVRYWKIWNEPAFTPEEILDILGSGCFGNTSTPDQGGAYYAEVVKRVSVRLKAVNPDNHVIAATVVPYKPNAPLMPPFLTSLLEHAGQSFDSIAFSAYGEFGNTDRMITQAANLRRVLDAYGLQDRKVFATEVGAVCPAPTSYCPSADYYTDQANYAARIYPQALAGPIDGMFWFSLDSPDPGFFYSHVLQVSNTQLTVRPAYYALRNSVDLLSGARYLGASPYTGPNPARSEAPQILGFAQPDRTIYVAWVAPNADWVRTSLAVPPGSRATCLIQLALPVPEARDCSDTDRDGRIAIKATNTPLYILVSP